MMMKGSHSRFAGLTAIIAEALGVAFEALLYRQ